LVAKRLELLRELVPAATSIGLLANMTRPSSGVEVRAAQQAMQTLGASLYVQSASTAGEINAALANFAQHRINALLIGSDPFLNTQRDQIVALVSQLAVPTMYNLREYVAAGGLISYAPSLADVYHQAGVYTAKILKGAKPADLPVVQPTKFELVINLKTAKALGLTVPLIMQMTADEVIE
ncbi:MAG: ABC transporter substrate-binding protein, partial [Xanthobacteraceae bacterium]